MLVIQQELADELDLLDLIIRRCGQPLERLGLDAIDSASTCTISFNASGVRVVLIWSARAASVHCVATSVTGASTTTAARAFIHCDVDI
jgi:hypothetical protein